MQRACISWIRVLGGVCALVIAVALSPRAEAFAFTFAGSPPASVDTVAHPIGYTGASTPNLTISVGIHSSSAHSAEMVTPVQNVIATWNGLVPTTGNFGPANVPFTQFDFESVLLHEMGHALGLDHPNLGQQPGVTGANTDYTNSTPGPNGTFTFNAGPDGVIGSRDDVRGDDVNLNYFRTSNNDPFTIAGTVDSTTYSRNLGALPVGSVQSANSSRDVANLLGYGSNTESSLQQGIFNGEARRTLGHDDVAGIKYAMSGLDEIAGTSDDYTLTLTYAGITTSADILVKFEDGHSGFAVTELNGTFIGATDHIRVTDAPIFFQDTDIPWFFNTVAVPEPGSLALMGVAAAAGIGAYVRRRRLTLQPSAKR